MVTKKIQIMKVDFKRFYKVKFFKLNSLTTLYKIFKVIKESLPRKVRAPYNFSNK